ncbi:MAG TPA: cytochrome c, partial [Kofleriaceae bacterium]
MRRLTASYILLTVAVVAAAPADRPIGRVRGADLYERFCLACHGANGDGHGPAAPWSWGAPRSFVQSAFKWKTTDQGEPPSDDDLRLTIQFGAPGTSMPGFAFRKDELADVIEY